LVEIESRDFVPRFGENALVKPSPQDIAAALLEDEPLSNPHPSPQAIGIFEAQVAGFALCGREAYVVSNGIPRHVEPTSLTTDTQEHFEVLSGRQRRIKATEPTDDIGSEERAGSDSGVIRK
jgi:hypothetical protein